MARVAQSLPLAAALLEEGSTFVVVFWALLDMIELSYAGTVAISVEAVSRV